MNTLRPVFWFSLLAITPCSVTIAADPAPSTAEDGERAALDTVVVTARKKSEALQDVPMSVSALDAEQLDDYNIRDLEDLAAYVPGLQQQSLAITTRLSLRGVNSGDNNAFEQSVGTYVDGIYRGRMNQQHIGLFDVERLEVLKGPQVALYGNSSIGGAISVITQKPGLETGGYFNYRYESEYQTHQLQTAADLPLNEQFALRVALSGRDQGRGIQPNDFSGRSEPRFDDQAARLSALWLPTDALSISMRHEQGRYERDGHIFEVFKHVDGQGNPWPNSVFTGVNDGRLNLGNGAPFKYRSAFLHTEIEETQLEIEYLFDTVTLTSITGFSGYDYRHSADVDITPATVINVYQDEEFSQFSQELRLAGSLSPRTDYLIGVYYQDDDFRNDYLSDFNLPLLVAPAFGVDPGLVGQLISPFSRHILLDQTTEQQALFGSLDVAINDRLTASLGFRYVDIDKRADQAVRTATLDHVDTLGRLIDLRWLDPQLAPLLLGNPDYLADPTGYVLVLADGSRIEPVLAPDHAVGYNIVSFGAGALHEFNGLRRNESHPMYQASLAYDWSPDLMTYISWSSGAKAGGFDFLYEGADRDAVEYADESANVLELGMKSSWERVRLNLALFYGRYEDLQVSVFDGGIGFVVGNAASSISKGLDAEFAWQIGHGLSLFANYLYLDFSYDEFPGANCSTTERLNLGQALCDWSGDPTPFVPRVESVLGLEHNTVFGSWALRQVFDWRYKGSHSTASDNEIQTRQESYSLFDYRIELSPEARPWSLALVGKNLTDRRYNVFTSVIPLAPGGAFASVRAPGRELAVEFQYRF